MCLPHDDIWQRTIVQAMIDEQAKMMNQPTDPTFLDPDFCLAAAMTTIITPSPRLSPPSSLSQRDYRRGGSHDWQMPCLRQRV